MDEGAPPELDGAEEDAVPELPAPRAKPALRRADTAAIGADADAARAATVMSLIAERGHNFTDRRDAVGPRGWRAPQFGGR